MPEFILDHGNRESALAFKALDLFTQGYIEAMFFTSTGSADDEDLQDASVAELAPDAWNKIVEDCKKFQADNALDIEDALAIDPTAYDLEAVGRDFWYSRNGHGVGFWDRGLGQIGDKLHAACKKWRELYLYRGDDGLIYVD